MSECVCTCVWNTASSLSQFFYQQSVLYHFVESNYSHIGISRWGENIILMICFSFTNHIQMTCVYMSCFKCHHWWLLSLVTSVYKFHWHMTLQLYTFKILFFYGHQVATVDYFLVHNVFTVLLRKQRWKKSQFTMAGMVIWGALEHLPLFSVYTY